jgi:hypothetical protein
MQTSPSHSSSRDPQRLARNLILNGMPVSPVIAAQLEALGINVGDFTNRILARLEFLR